MDIFVGIVLLDKNDRIYLIKEDDKNQISAGRWNLPGGGIENDESLTQAAKRESKEETGYEVKINSLLGVYKVNKDEENWMYLVFGGYKDSNQEKISDTDVKEGRWFSKDELLKIDVSKLVHTDIKNVYQLFLENKGLLVNTVKSINY